MKGYENTTIFTDMVGMAKFINRLNEDKTEYRIIIDKGISGEDIVAIKWIYKEED